MKIYLIAEISLSDHKSFTYCYKKI